MQTLRETARELRYLGVSEAELAAAIRAEEGEKSNA